MLHCRQAFFVFNLEVYTLFQYFISGDNFTVQHIIKFCKEHSEPRILTDYPIYLTIHALTD